MKVILIEFAMKFTLSVRQKDKPNAILNWNPETRFTDTPIRRMRKNKRQEYDISTKSKLNIIFSMV